MASLASAATGITTEGNSSRQPGPCLAWPRAHRELSSIKDSCQKEVPKSESHRLSHVGREPRGSASPTSGPHRATQKSDYTRDKERYRGKDPVSHLLCLVPSLCQLLAPMWHNKKCLLGPSGSPEACFIPKADWHTSCSSGLCSRN